MNFHLVSVITDCRFSKNGLDKLLSGLGNDGYVVNLILDSYLPLQSNKPNEVNIGRQVMKFLSKGMIVEVISLSVKQSIESLKDKLKMTLSQCILSHEKKELINNLNDEENYILYCLLAGMKPIDIARELHKPLFIIYASKYEIYEKLKITKRERLLNFFDKVTIVILK